jgi:predicted dehydrogenase
VHDSKRVVQIGTASSVVGSTSRQARQEIHDGRLGQVTLIRTYWFQNHIPSMGRVLPSTCPSCDWKRLSGLCRRPPFDPDQFGNWRWYWDFGGGAMTDLFVHWVDVAHWIMIDDTPTRAPRGQAFNASWCSGRRRIP